ncbi:DUF2750 domain-containing protein [Flavobacterium columnare]|uniref:DUF2750 domain-containing protein n=1 Tax=Flavobacterium columnare TaxID=996 RepID=UPI00403336E3
MITNQIEIENVIKLDAFDRYKYFLKRVADNEELYTLKNKKGNYNISRLENKELLPLWSSKEFAELCLINGWEDSIIEKISLDDFEEELIDYIADNDLLLNVFPVYEKTGFVLNLKEFSRDLGEELNNYE